MTRAEHLQWAKDRALEYIERGDAFAALTSFASDMSKHEELADHLGLDPRMIVAETGFPKMELDRTRRWIEGFN